MVFTVKLNDDIENQLIMLARKTGQTKTFHIHEALVDYIKSRVKKTEKEIPWFLDEPEAVANLEE